MPLKPKEHLLTRFGPNQWTGWPAKDAGSLFLGSGFLTFLVCLLIMILMEPLRDFFVIVGLCTLVATISVVADIVFTAKREKSFLTDLTAQVNDSILEITGDPNARVAVGKLRELIEYGRSLPLHINGVPGVELKVDGKRLEEKRILAVVTGPDYGLESFDLLLEAELQRNS